MANEENLTPWEKGQSGNPGGVSKARLTFRQLIEQAVTDKDFSGVVKVLLKAAKKGEPWAVREFFDLTVGRNWNIALKHKDVESESRLSIFELIEGARKQRELEARG